MSDGASTMSQPRLLVMLFDRLVLDVQQAGDALRSKNLELANDKLCHAQAILLELHAALDQKAWGGADRLGQVYLWINNELMRANVSKEAKPVDDCLRMLRELQGAWQGAYDTVMTEQAAAASAATAGKARFERTDTAG